MGLFSASRSRTNQNITTTAIDQRVGAAEGSIGVGAGGSLTETVTQIQQAPAEMFALLGTAIESVSETARQSVLASGQAVTRVQEGQTALLSTLQTGEVPSRFPVQNVLTLGVMVLGATYLLWKVAR